MPGTGGVLSERDRLLLATCDTLHDDQMSAQSSLILYITGINLITFAMFAWDKYTAIKGQWRVPEKTLLMLALVGGSPGAIIAQQRLRHKTRKQPFRAQLLLIAGLHVLLVVALAIPVSRQLMFEQLHLLLASWEG